jgi:beta-mannosidase
MIRRELHQGWTVTPAGGPVPESIAGKTFPATVPGVVHIDLRASGAIADPYVGINEQAVAWVGQSRWRYELHFDWDAKGEETRHDLVCDGLDTVASLTLNGVPIGSVANQHRRYRFDLRGVLVPGPNHLVIEFESALEAAEAMQRRLGRRPQVYPHPYAMVRKSACNFGWDWGPEVITAGVWRAIAIESWSGSRIDAVRPTARADGTVRVAVDLERDHDEPVEVRCEIAGVAATALAGDHIVLDLSVAEPELWWPRGFGGQKLYRLLVSTLGDERSMRVGFRTVRVDATPDAGGIPFQVNVNDIAVFVRGANWIPDDAFPSTVDRTRYERRVSDAVEANINLLRVWGGGIYESDDFYELCDEHGLLVWQDFLFACAAYPEEEPLWSEVTAEARDAINRLARHPSLVIWNGANENIWGHADWGWKAELGDRTWGEGYYLDLLPSLVAQLDPDRPYIPNSPFSWERRHHPNDPADGLVHIWDVWNQRDYTAYAGYRPRFVAEFGFQGPPAWSTLVRAVRDEPLRPDGPELLAHQKAADGQQKLQRGYEPHFPRPGDFTDWHWTTQLNQARAIRFGIEHFRSLSPLCQGSIVWQLNDCWPVVSWAAVDGDGRRKPLWHALRAAYADRIICFDGDDLAVVNDSASPYAAQVVVTRHGLAGNAIASLWVPLTVLARSTTRIALGHPFVRDPAAAGYVSARAPGLAVTVRLDREPRDGLPPQQLQTFVSATPSGYRLDATARSLVLDLCIFPDRLDPAATVDQSMVTLLPGESATFEIATSKQLDLTALTRRPVLRTANDLCTR